MNSKIMLYIGAAAYIVFPVVANSASRESLATLKLLDTTITLAQSVAAGGRSNSLNIGALRRSLPRVPRLRQTPGFLPRGGCDSANQRFQFQIRGLDAKFRLEREVSRQRQRSLVGRNFVLPSSLLLSRISCRPLTSGVSYICVLFGCSSFLLRSLFFASVASPKHVLTCSANSQGERQCLLLPGGNYSPR